MIFLNRLKVLLRQPAIWLWTIVFPLCLASFEYMAFGKLSDGSFIDTMEIYIATEEEYQIDENLKKVFEEAKLDEDKNLFHVVEIGYEEGIEKFNQKKINLFLYKAEDKFILKTEESSISAGITTQIIEKYAVTALTIQQAYEKYYADLALGVSNVEQPDAERILKELNEEFHYFNDTTRNVDANALTIYFYSLIAMMCLYATFWGKQIIEDVRADQSPLGIRISVAPTSKYKLIVLYYLAAAVLQLISCITLFVYLKWILKVALGDNVFLVLLCMLVGSFTGISLGMFVSIFMKGTKEKKEALLSILTLVLCIFAGLMFINLKQMMDMYVPFLKYINPAQLITDGLYSLYYYSSTKFYWLRIGILFGMNLLFIGATIWKIRGEKYASI